MKLFFGRVGILIGAVLIGAILLSSCEKPYIEIAGTQSRSLTSSLSSDRTVSSAYGIYLYPTTHQNMHPVTSVLTLPSETQASQPQISTMPSTPSTDQPASGLFLMELNDSVKRGSKVTLTVRGLPNTKYSITVRYSSGVSHASGLEDRMSDAEGICSWTWRVGASTKPGVYPITLSDGVNSYTLQLVVTD